MKSYVIKVTEPGHENEVRYLTGTDGAYRSTDNILEAISFGSLETATMIAEMMEKMLPLKCEPMLNFGEKEGLRRFLKAILDERE